MVHWESVIQNLRWRVTDKDIQGLPVAHTHMLRHVRYIYPYMHTHACICIHTCNIHKYMYRHIKNLLLQQFLSENFQCTSYTIADCFSSSFFNCSERNRNFQYEASSVLIVWQ